MRGLRHERAHHYQVRTQDGRELLEKVEREKARGDPWDELEEDFGAKRKEEVRQGNGQNSESSIVIEPRQFIWRDPKTISPRGMLYGDHYYRKFFSCTLAPGGSGKSSASMVEYVAMTANRNFLGSKPIRPLKVWYWNLEDSMDELDRRLAAICLHYGITREDLGGRLFINSGRQDRFVIATRTRRSDNYQPTGQGAKGRPCRPWKSPAAANGYKRSVDTLNHKLGVSHPSGAQLQVNRVLRTVVVFTPARDAVEFLATNERRTMSEVADGHAAAIARIAEPRLPNNNEEAA